MVIKVGRSILALGHGVAENNYRENDKKIYLIGNPMSAKVWYFRASTGVQVIS